MNKTRKSHRLIAIFFLTIFFPTLLPGNALFASNNGPNAPEAVGFEPVTATDMVNLATGDMSYVLPVMDVGGFPVTMSYHGGVPLDLESSWTGLGWNLNTGAINRSMNATPDDWNGGNSIDYIKYFQAEEQYNIDVGVGVSKAVEVGVGMSWGSNKSLSGSVFASVGFTPNAGASARIDTDGNYSLGASFGAKDGGGNAYGGGVSVSGNLNSGKKDVSVGVGAQTASGLSVGMGASLTGNGVSASLGYGNHESNGLSSKGVAGGGALSMSSFSMGDWDVQSKGWYIPIHIKFLSFGFGKRKITYTLEKGFKKKGFGILYANNLSNANDVVENDAGGDNVFNDYQNRYRYTDAYDQSLPVSEAQFVGDYDAEREKLNFTFAGYDAYDVNASGISGIVKPKVLQNSTLFGLGYNGTDPLSVDNPQTKMRIYGHNGYTTDKSFGTNTTNDIRFYFDGQFTQNRAVQPLAPISNAVASGNNLNNILSTRAALNTTRLQQGNFVEVYTNEQIRNGSATGLLAPEGVPNSARTNDKFIKDGIGGYKITAPDGKVYHFSLPVYHYEQVDRTLYKDNSEDHVSDKRQYTPYATHWLLTAITGPDFYDANGNNMADPGDYGYWVRLDHGKWSDGYVWRTPTDKGLKDYFANIEGNIGDKDFGYYQFGRKQLYYLDKIVSPTHTAYFVKDLRYDSVGSDLNFFFTQSGGTSNEGTGGGTIYPYENFTYKRQQQLMLKKIVLVRNDKATVTTGGATNPLRLNEIGLSDYVNSYAINYNPNGGFIENGNTILINQEHKVIDVKDFEGFNYNNAIKVVDFDYNYNLAGRNNHNDPNNPALSKGSPGTILHPVKNPNAGKLTLKRIKILGRNNYDYMPPYQFEYDGEYKGEGQPFVPYPANRFIKNNSGEPIALKNVKAKDEWGFNKLRPEAWSMTKVITPTGASIAFEHEQDDYYIEAFSRRFWTDNLKYYATDLGTHLQLDIENENGLTPQNMVQDFRKYFENNQRVFLDLWMCREVRGRDWIGSIWSDTGQIDVYGPNISTVTNVTQNHLTIRVLKEGYTIAGNDKSRITGEYFSKSAGPGHQYDPMPRGVCAEANIPGLTTSDHWTISYRLLANKVPEDETGGGLRVKSITLNDESNNKYKTSYYYNMPGTSKAKGTGNYKSSGITSFSPVNGAKFIPYQSELPSAGVMYEYVTMVAENTQGNTLGETRYRFYVLRPVYDIFDPNIKMFDDDGNKMFEAIVTDHKASGSEYLNPDANKKIKAKSIKLNVNTSLVGQFRSVEEFNNKGQLMSKSEKKYLSGEALKFANNNRGSVMESFQSMKSIFRTNAADQNPVLKERLLSIATKEEYSSILKSVVTTNAFGKSVEEYADADPMTGTFNTVISTKADGRKSKIERIPAYTKYSAMGSKVTNAANKNMLTQDAVTVTSVMDNTNNWKILNAAITSWNDTWSYRDNLGNEVSPVNTGEKIWRKHKSFVWKENISDPVLGAYTTQNLAANNYFFNWSTGLPTNAAWKKTSEITRYTRASIPLEVKDINGNAMASKMVDKNTKVSISGNARFTEIYYTGGEHVDPGNDQWFEGEIFGAKNRNYDIAHTGKSSFKGYMNGQTILQISGTTGGTDYYTASNYTAKFRPGKYKVSLWAYKKGDAASNAQLQVNGVAIKPKDIVAAGCWEQLNYYFDLPPNGDVLVKLVTTNVNGYNYFDDFRMHPIEASVKTYVYDPETDEVATILDANNLGASFRYDPAGRVIATYAETLNSGSFVGGFKLVSQNRQSYKGATPVNFEIAPTIVNCLPDGDVYEDLEATVSEQCKSEYERTFKVVAKGGSGQYGYQYKWLINAQNNTFSNYVNGTATQNIPFAPVYNCSADPGYYAKRWSYMVKVKDLITGEEIELPLQNRETSCMYRYNVKQWAEITMEECSKFCGPDTNSYKIFVRDPNPSGNYKYEYAYYDPAQLDTFHTQNLNFINVTDTQGRFCPVYSYIPDENCPSGSRQIAYITYRVTNLDTGEVTPYFPEIFYGACSTSSWELSRQNASFTIDNNYVKEGNALQLDQQGNVVRQSNIKAVE